MKARGVLWMQTVVLVVGMLMATTVKGQFATPYLLRGGVEDDSPVLSLSVSAASLDPVRPTISLDAELWNPQWSFRSSSKIGLSVRGSVAVPGIVSSGDTVPGGQRALLGSGTGISASIWPYIKSYDFGFLTTFLYSRFEQHVWPSFLSPASTDLSALRVTYGGVSFAADVQNLVSSATADSTEHTLIVFEGSYEHLRLQNDGLFRGVVRDLSSNTIRYGRVRLGVRHASTYVYAEVLRGSGTEVWVAGLSVRL